MKKKRVWTATHPFDNVQTRYATRNWQARTPVTITIDGAVKSIFVVKLKDLRRLWELNDDSFVERIIVPEPDEIERDVTDEKTMSADHSDRKIFIVDWIKMDSDKTEQQFERWWQERGHELALEFARDSGETPVAYEGLALCIKEICLDCWNWSK